MSHLFVIEFLEIIDFVYLSSLLFYFDDYILRKHVSVDVVANQFQFIDKLDWVSLLIFYANNFEYLEVWSINFEQTVSSIACIDVIGVMSEAPAFFHFFWHTHLTSNI